MFPVPDLWGTQRLAWVPWAPVLRPRPTMRIEVLALASLLSCRDHGSSGPVLVPEAEPSVDVEEVSLVRRWAGSNDFLVLTLHRTGEAMCRNAWPTWPVRGENCGVLGQGDFEEVVKLIDGLRLAALAGSLREPGSFEGSILLKWRGVGERSATTLECAEGEAPVALVAAALAVEAVGRRVLWKPVERTSDSLDETNRRLLSSAMPAGVPERYAFLYAFPWETEADVLARALPYERIELERSGCYGSCPSYLLRLTRAGVATWEGRAYSEPGGARTGSVGLLEFGRLCWFIEKLDLERLAGSYSASWTDDQTTEIRLVKTNGTVISFEDYGRRAPIEVQALGALLELVARQNGWARKVEGEVSIDSKVLQVDRQLGQVVLDKGLRDGMRTGYLFHIFLASEYKGTVRVEVAQDTTSSARILNEKHEMQPGDSASTDL